MTKTKLQTAMGQAITAAIGGDKKHGWGIDDSVEVIETLIAEDAPDGYAPSDELMSLIREVVNPSQFRQKLEAEKMLEAPERKRNKSVLKSVLS